MLSFSSFSHCLYFIFLFFSLQFCLLLRVCSVFFQFSSLSLLLSFFYMHLAQLCHVGATLPFLNFSPLHSIYKGRGMHVCAVASAFLQRAEGNSQGCSCTVQVSEQCRDMQNLWVKKYNLVSQFGPDFA